MNEIGVGSQFGPYRLDELLGRGGMGEVYRAFDTTKDRVVAIKLLHTNFANDPVYQKRFRLESHAAARLGEPHIIPIHDWGEIDGVLFIDMRLVEGDDLRGVLRAEGALSPARAVNILEQVAAALDAAHASGLVHRDIKPENVLVTKGDFTYLVDFGIARDNSSATQLTETGAAIGSFAYMAPERFEQGPADPASDVYALACVLFECLTGRVPYPQDSLSAAIKATLFAEPPTVSTGTGIPPAMDAVIAKGLAKAPADRYASAGEFAAAARAALTAPAGTGVPPETPTVLATPPAVGTRPLGSPDPSGQHYAPTMVGATGGSVAGGSVPGGPGVGGPPPPGALPPPGGGPAGPPPQKSSGRSTILIGAAAALAVVLVASVVVFLLVRDNGAEATEAAPDSTTGEVSTDTETESTPTTEQTTEPTTEEPSEEPVRLPGRISKECPSPDSNEVRTFTANDTTQCEWALNVQDLVELHEPDEEIADWVRSPAVARNQPERNPNLWTTCSRKSGYYDCAGGISGHVWVLSR